MLVGGFTVPSDATEADESPHPDREMRRVGTGIPSSGLDPDSAQGTIVVRRHSVDAGQYRGENAMKYLASVWTAEYGHQVSTGDNLPDALRDLADEIEDGLAFEYKHFLRDIIRDNQWAVELYGNERQEEAINAVAGLARSEADGDLIESALRHDAEQVLRSEYIASVNDE